MRTRCLIVVALLAASSLPAFLASCGRPSHAAQSPKRVLVLGIDGMDPKLLAHLIAEGRMPNFSDLGASGAFVPLETSAPPQSPVAWSNFIVGADPSTHQIFDFIHRDPAPSGGLAVLPYLSTSKIIEAEDERFVSLGSWRIPLSGSKTVSLRQGRAFWDHLVDHGVDSTIYRVPANYPPPQVKGTGKFRCLCGMGTPDLLGSYGQFTLFTPNVSIAGKTVSGGRKAQLLLHQHHGIAVLEGPPNFLRPEEDRRPNPMTVELEVVRDPEAHVAKISAGDQTVLLNAGEWSDWFPIRFETGIPGSPLLGAAQLPTGMDAMVRFYLKQVHPDLKIYVSPLNLDPLRPVNPIGAPDDFSSRLAENVGRYYTTGIPEDTKALRADALTEDEFLQQVGLLKEERLKQYRYALEHFDEGFMFFYFGHVDQLSHIFWRDRDPDHPAHDPEEAARYSTVIEDAYIEMDALLAEAKNILDDGDTLIIMSDHGFTSFRRGFNLNSWLIENGYLNLAMPDQREHLEFLVGVDWTRTRAYALGLNALYLNLAQREARGVVTAREQDQLLEEIAGKLKQVRDTDGAAIIDTVYIVKKYYPNADGRIAPDMLIGYADHYRASWATAVGGMPNDLVEDNTDRWSGDHCIAHHIVPGILLTNRSVTVSNPGLTDLAPTILAEFGIDKPEEMTGRAIFSGHRP